MGVLVSFCDGFHEEFLVLVNPNTNLQVIANNHLSCELDSLFFGLALNNLFISSWQVYFVLHHECKFSLLRIKDLFSQKKDM
jgi:hypothetical protein